MVGSATNVFVSAFSCVMLCTLYVFIIQPTIFHLFGLQQPDTDHTTGKKKITLQQKHEYSQRYANTLKKKDRSSGIIATILPFYAFGIFAYFVYTIAKIFNKRRRVNSKKKEAHLKEYYRNFRYVPEKEKFKMDSDSSEDEFGNGPLCNIGWPPALERPDVASDVYRSVAGLPKDLEYLLNKADQDNLDDAEVTQLRTRLEQMESEMTRLLDAVTSSASLFAQTPNIKSGSWTTEAQCTGANSDDSEALFSAEEN